MLNSAINSPIFNINNTTPSPLSTIHKKSITILSFNARFFLGAQKSYPFEGGKDQILFTEYYDSLKNFENLITKYNPDVICLQEILIRNTFAQFFWPIRLFHSANQEKELSWILGKKNTFHSYTYALLANGFIPHPKQPGWVSGGTFIFSKKPITKASRYKLFEDIHINKIVRYFYPKRYALYSFISSLNLHIYSVHLSTFSQGTKTLQKQIQQVHDLLSLHKKNKEHSLIIGDFNVDALSSKNKELHVLFNNFQGFPTLESMQSDKKNDYINTRTSDNLYYNKTFNYAFLTNHIDVRHMQIIHEEDFSDHRPVLIEIALPDHC